MIKKPILIDCDPGVDDALAIYLAFASKELDVKAITVVGGNQVLEKTAHNALNLVDYLGSDVKVSKGANGPMVRELTIADEVHGDSGIGDVVLESSKRDFYEKDAYETIYEEAIKADGELHIVAIGPLTNLAITFLKYPDIKEKIKHITIMGGAANGGNVTPCAEFNIYVDPEAAKIVFESGIPLTMVGLDATHRAYLTGEEIDEMGKKFKKDIPLNGIKLLKFTQKLCEMFGLEGVVMHDPSALASVIDPSVLTYKECHVDVEVRGEITRGKTVVDFDDVKKLRKNALVAVDTDREKFVSMMENMLTYYENK